MANKSLFEQEPAAVVVLLMMQLARGARVQTSIKEKISRKEVMDEGKWLV